jgi:hypothetical protein
MRTCGGGRLRGLEALPGPAGTQEFVDTWVLSARAAARWWCSVLRHAARRRGPDRCFSEPTPVSGQMLQLFTGLPSWLGGAWSVDGCRSDAPAAHRISFGSSGRLVSIRCSSCSRGFLPGLGGGRSAIVDGRLWFRCSSCSRGFLPRGRPSWSALVVRVLVGVRSVDGWGFRCSSCSPKFLSFGRVGAGFCASPCAYLLVLLVLVWS